MKILYLTNAISQNDYPDFLKLWKIALNTSNQNFHYRFIKLLSSFSSVDVISFRPINKNCLVKKFSFSATKENEISWKYLTIKKNKIIRYLSFKKELNSLSLLNNKFDYIFVDGMNILLLKFALSLSKKYNCKVISIITDNPVNISYTNKKYKKDIILFNKKAHSFVTLTEDLNTLVNHDNKPYIVIKGINDDYSFTKKQKEGKYFFFAGALMEKYGIYNLIEAFSNINRQDIKLIIAGHHKEEPKFTNAISKNKNIEFLGALPFQEIKEYEKGAIANINPRPMMGEIDKYSVPSQTIEYAGMGKIVISGKSNQLTSIFKDSIIWLDKANVEELQNALNKVLSISEENRILMGQRVNKIADDNFSIKVQKDKLESFLKNLKK